MRFVFWPGPHASFAEVLALAERAEALGWHGVCFADHFLPSTGEPARPTLECWSVLAALAARVPRVALGPLVCGATYRDVGLLAAMAASVDAVSGGRLVLGVGAAWQENEHHAFGIAFPPIAERLARLDAQCAALRSGSAEVARLPLLVGGGGERMTLRIAARHADAWNCWGLPATMRHKNAVLDRHCAALGRDPRAILRSAVAHFHLTDDPGEAARLRTVTSMPCVAGSASEIRAAIAAYEDAGVGEIVVPDFQWPRTDRLARLERLSREVVTNTVAHGATRNA